MFAAVLQCLAWCAALGALVWEPAPGASGAFSRAGACALPFVLLGGLPRIARRAADGNASDAWRGAGLWLALAAAPLVCAARADVLAGVDVHDAVHTAAVAGFVVAALAWASERADGSTLHAAAWLALVVGPPVLAGVLDLAAVSSRAPAWSSALAEASPLAWTWRAARAPEHPPFDATLVAALAGLALVVASARVRPRRSA